MTPLAIGLILVSAVLHASWNYLGKRSAPTASFFLLANTAGFLALTPVLLANLDAVRALPPIVMLYLGVTGFFQAVYYGALAGAYRSGDMSVAYPLARSSPIIVVTASTILLGRWDEIGMLCALGALLIVGGCFLVPMRRFTDLRLSNYLNASCGLAVVAAFGTAGYSMVDDEALRLVRELDGWAASPVERTLVYACGQALTSSLWLALVVFGRRVGRQTMARVWRVDRYAAVATGIAIYVTYSIVLVSMAFAQNVSYIVAFRQVSIPIGVALGVVLLGEPLHAPKLAGVGVLVVGLVLVAMG